MKSKKIRVMLAVLAMLIGISSRGWAFWPQKGQRPSAQQRIERMAKELGLTAEQKEKYLMVEKRIEKEAQEIHAQNRAIFDKVESELLKDPPNRKLLADYMQQISENDAQIRLKRLEQMVQLRQELTVEQKNAFNKMMKERIGQRRFGPKKTEAH